MRVSAKVDYAIRALAELAAAQLAAGSAGPVKGERLAEAQAIPLKFLENILTELRRAELVASQRGRRDPRGRGADRDRPRLPPRGGRLHGCRGRAGRDLDRAAREHARGARGDLARRPRRALGRLAEDTLPFGADPHDLPALELELLAGVARQLRPELLAVAAHELDPDLEAEMDDPLDHRLLGLIGGREQHLQVVRAHP